MLPLGAAPYPTLHALEVKGLVTRSEERLPRYVITGAGRIEAERLAAAFWPAARRAAQRFATRLAVLFPDGPAGVRAASGAASLGTGS